MDLPHYHSTGQPVIRQRRDTRNRENIGWDSRPKCRRPDLDMVKQRPPDEGMQECRGQSSWRTACAIGGK
jgi:hypothetical protein